MAYRNFYLDSTPCGWRKGPQGLRIFGVPFDGTVSYRSGTRWGPASFRQAIMNIEVFSPRYGIDLEEFTVSDLGDVRTAWSVEETTKAVKKVVSDLISDSKVPLLIVGGEHSLTYGSFQAMPKKTGLLVFDAHFDLRDEYAGLGLSHATFLRRLIEDVGPEQVVHVGARAATRSEWDFAKSRKLIVVEESSLSDVRAATSAIKRAIQRFEMVYVSVDLDVLDPAFAPGVGNPEPGGLSVKDLLGLFEPLREVKVPCFDIVELSPPYDSGLSAAAAARLAVELAATQIQREGLSS